MGVNRRRRRIGREMKKSTIKEIDGKRATKYRLQHRHGRREVYRLIRVRSSREIEEKYKVRLNVLK